MRRRSNHGSGDGGLWVSPHRMAALNPGERLWHESSSGFSWRQSCVLLVSLPRLVLRGGCDAGPPCMGHELLLQSQRTVLPTMTYPSRTAQLSSPLRLSVGQQQHGMFNMHPRRVLETPGLPVCKGALHLLRMTPAPAVCTRKSHVCNRRAGPDDDALDARKQMCGFCRCKIWRRHVLPPLVS